MLEQLAHYKILDRIGAGGMGEVYRARDTRLGRTVAVKVLPPAVANDPGRRERFMREAQAAAALSHPNVAALFEAGEDGGCLFLAFEFVPGQTLTKEINGRPMNPHQAIHLGVQVADALADAHALGIVHRDLKPDNIIVTPKGHAKVLDFGLAKWTQGGADRDRAATTLATEAGVALGTAAYMSPEQALGHPIDHRTDIFSLGIVLYEMLTGSRPFQGTTSTAVALQIVQTDPPLPSSANRAVPVELDAVVARMLAKNPGDRCESAATLAAELRAIDAILDVRSEAAERATAAAASKRPARSMGRWVVVAALIAVAVTAVWWTRSTLQRAWHHTIGPAPQPLIAVVPFETDADRTSFADGLADDLITRLGQTPGLKVLGRSATRSFRGKAPREVARETGAAVVLTGSVRPSAGAIKMSIELIDPDDGAAIWSNQYTHDVKDVFAVQAEVADAVASALRVKLQPTASGARAASRTVDPKAYELYARGRQAAADRNLESAKQLYRQSIQLDEGLAEAHAGLAETLRLEATFAAATDDPARRAAIKQAAERAFEIDPDLPQANLAVAMAADALGDALDALKKSISLDPSFAEAYHQLGDEIVDFDPPRAVAFYRHAAMLDPRMDVNHADTVSALLLLGRVDAARAELASAPDPQNVWKAPLRSAVALEQHRYDEAVDVIRQGKLDESSPALALAEVFALRMADRADDAVTRAAALVAKRPGYCEARAALAGLRQEKGQTAAARRLAAPLLADLSAIGPATVRCATLSAAAVADAQTAALLVKRIAGDQRMLRSWAQNVAGTTGSKLVRRDMFPWNHVVDAPPVVEAMHALDGAYEIARQQIAAVLDPVTPK